MRMKIYDFGCGNHKWPNAIGIDSDMNSDAEIIGDVETFILPQSCADKVVMIHFLEHVNCLTTLKKAYEVLKPNGEVYIETPNAHSASIILRLILRNKYMTSDFHVQTFGREELKNALRLSGFVAVSISYKNLELRFCDFPRMGFSNKVGRLISKILPQLSEVIVARGVKL